MPLRRHLDRFVGEQMADCRIPGLTLAVLDGGEVVHMRAYGVADASGTPMTIETPLHIASLTKSFTALAILSQVDKGLLDLDDPWSRYMGNLHAVLDDAVAKITIRQLLSHTSGIAGNAAVALSDSDVGKSSSVAMLSRWISSLRTIAGQESFQYSNANYVLLGMVLEAISGMRFEDVLQQQVLQPMGLSGTGMATTDHGFVVPAGYRTVFGFPVQVRTEIPTVMGSAYGMQSTVVDLVEYVRLLMGNNSSEGKLPIAAASKDLLFVPTARVSGQEQYAFGWFVTASTVHHGGELPWAQCKVVMDRTKNRAVIFLYNTSSSAWSALFNLNYRDRIEQGILDILDGHAPRLTDDGLGVLDAHRYPVRVVQAAYLMLCAWVVWQMGMMVKRAAFDPVVLPHRRKTRSMMIAGAVVVHFVLPLVLLVGIPRAWDTTWREIFRVIPDTASVLALVVCVPVATGFLLAVRWRRASCA